GLPRRVQPFAVHVGVRAAQLDHLAALEACGTHGVAHRERAGAHVLLPVGIGGDRRDARQRLELVQEVIEVFVDVAGGVLDHRGDYTPRLWRTKIQSTASRASTAWSRCRSRIRSICTPLYRAT